MSLRLLLIYVSLLTMRRFHVLATSAILSDTKEQPAPSRAILFGSLFIISKRTRDAWSALHYKNNNNNTTLLGHISVVLVSRIHNAVTINRSLFYRHDSVLRSNNDWCALYIQVKVKCLAMVWTKELRTYMSWKARARGVLPEKLGGGVRLTSQNPFP